MSGRRGRAQQSRDKQQHQNFMGVYREVNRQGVDEATADMEELSLDGKPLTWGPGPIRNIFGDYGADMDIEDSHLARVPYWVQTFVYEWLPKLKAARNSSRATGLEEFNAELRNCFNRSKDSFWTTIYLVAYTPDVADGIQILRAFQTYLQTDNSLSLPNPAAFRSDQWEIKSFAFIVAFRKNDEILRDMIVDIYKLSGENPNIFLLVGEVDIRLNCYDVAARGAAFFNLQKYFEIEEIAFPLLMQNKLKELEAFLDGAVDQQNQFVQYVDALCTEGTDLAAVTESLGIPNVDHTRLKQTAMLKALNRFIKKYNVDKKYYPKQSQTTSIGSIAYLIHLFYAEDGVLQEDFVDLLMDIVSDDKKLQLELVNKIRTHDVRGGAWFARRLNLPKNELPHELTIFLNSGTDAKPSREGKPAPARAPPSSNYLITYEDWLFKRRFCKFTKYAPIMPAVIHYVTDSAQFVNEVAKILKTTNIVAIDCEWKPTFEIGSPRIALLQLATENVVLIVDMLQIGPKMTDKAWSGFIEMMSDEHMLKLGYCFFLDFVALAGAHPALKDIAKVTTNLLDLKKLCSGVLEKHPSLFPYYNGHLPKQRRLDTFGELCLGVIISKKQQISKWDRRPLRQSQKDYAAADVHSLVDIYRVLQMRARDARIFDLKQFLPISAAAGTGAGDVN